MIETAVGTCKYCGQTCTVEVEESYSQEQVDEVVTSKCLCEEAKEKDQDKIGEGNKKYQSAVWGYRHGNDS